MLEMICLMAAPSPAPELSLDAVRPRVAELRTTLTHSELLAYAEGIPR